jgi:hypothetical protein
LSKATYMRFSFTSALIGGSLILLEALVSMLPPRNLPEIVVTLIGLSTGLGVLIGALMIRSSVQNKARIGSLLAIVFGLISVFAGGGFMVGLLLSILGGSLALLFALRSENFGPERTRFVGSQKMSMLLEQAGGWSSY